MRRGKPLGRKAPDCPDCVRQGRTICVHKKPRPEKQKKRKPIRPINPERKKRLYDRNFGDHADTIRRLPCVGCNPQLWSVLLGKGRVPAPGVVEVSDPAHAASRGAGGDKTDLFPACRDHHQMYDEHPWEWRKLFPFLDPHEIAAVLWERYGGEE